MLQYMVTITIYGDNVHLTIYHSVLYCLPTMHYGSSSFLVNKQYNRSVSHGNVGITMEAILSSILNVN